MTKRIDLRVKRTNKMIIDAFFELVEEKGYESVTIQDIAKKAMINRATFYAHFKDKQDLYEQMFDFAIDAFTSVIDSDQTITKNQIEIKKIEYLLTNIYINIQENKKFFLTIMDGGSNELLRKKLAYIISEKYSDIFQRLKIKENDIEVPIDFIIEYMTSIFVGTLHWWITSNTDMSPKDLAQLVVKLVGNGHLTILGIDIKK